jgi:hypothetical protein
MYHELSQKRYSHQVKAARGDYHHCEIWRRIGKQEGRQAGRQGPQLLRLQLQLHCMGFFNASLIYIQLVETNSRGSYATSNFPLRVE